MTLTSGLQKHVHICTHTHINYTCVYTQTGQLWKHLQCIQEFGDREVAGSTHGTTGIMGMKIHKRQ